MVWDEMAREKKNKKSKRHQDPEHMLDMHDAKQHEIKKSKKGKAKAKATMRCHPLRSCARRISSEDAPSFPCITLVHRYKHSQTLSLNAPPRLKPPCEDPAADVGAWW